MESEHFDFLSARAAALRPSSTKAMTAKAAALKQAGQNVIILSQGEPDFATPATIAQAGIGAIQAGHTRYTAVSGIDCITVSGGAKQVLFNAMLATLDPGDEVVIPTPAWVSYREMVRFAGGTPVEVSCTSAQGFKLTADQLASALSPNTKWLVLNSPCNPTGAVYRAGELAALADVLRTHPHVWVLSDDIYDQIVYGPTRCAQILQVAPYLQPRTLVVNGVSKGCAMTGWRLGWGAGPKPLVRTLNAIQSQSTSHASSISQYAAVEALTGDRSYRQAFVDAFRARRDIVVEAIKAIPGLRCRTPDGAFYAFVSCKELLGAQVPGGGCIETDAQFASYLLEQFAVAVVPGSAFAAPGYVRLSFASSPDDLHEACRRIHAACLALELPTMPKAGGL